MRVALQLPSGGLVTVRPGALTRLYSWVDAPSPDPAEIESVLNDLSDQELEFVMFIGTDSIASRIAWSEFGRRRGHVDFKVQLCVSAEEVFLEFQGDAKPMHRGVGIKTGDDGG